MGTDQSVSDDIADKRQVGIATLSERVLRDFGGENTIIDQPLGQPC
jgi:hypothetical protein